MSTCSFKVFSKGTSASWLHSTSTLPDLAIKIHATKDTYIVFLETSTLRSSSDLHTIICEQFNVPQHFWDPFHLESNGYFCASRKSSVPHGSEEGIPYVTCFRFLSKHATNDAASLVISSNDGQGSKSADISYTWDKLSFCTWWQPNGSSVLFCIDTPHLTQEEIRQSLVTGNANVSTSSPFYVHSFLLTFIVRNFERAVWSCRGLVRNLEKDRPSVERPNSDYIQMHEIARHAIHSSEVIGTSLIVIDGIIEELGKHWANIPDSSEALEIRRELQFHKSTLQCRRLRSQALEERLRNEINLAFHIGSQRDSIISAQIAEATQRDSTAMKTISVLGLVFLPGTLISSIFGMPFFSFDRTTGYVSDKFWVYWAVTAPITVVVLILWFLWQNYSLKRFQKASLIA